VGECGLDYHYDHSPRDAQRRAFESQLRVAKELDRPVVVHSREADTDIIAMVDSAAGAGVRGVLHCFTGTHAVAEAALAVGWYVSFSGIVTFKKWDDLALLQAFTDTASIAIENAELYEEARRSAETASTLLQELPGVT